MTVYNVGGVIAIRGVSEEVALDALRTKAGQAEMDLYDERVTLNEGLGAYVASGNVAGLFWGDSEEQAMGRFLNWILGRSGSLAKNVTVSVSEEVPSGWVR